MKHVYILQYSDCDNAYAVEAHLSEEKAIARWKECIEEIGLDPSIGEQPGGYIHGPYNMGRDQQSTDDGETYWLDKLELVEGD